MSDCDKCDGSGLRPSNVRLICGCKTHAQMADMVTVTMTKLDAEVIYGMLLMNPHAYIGQDLKTSFYRAFSGDKHGNGEAVQPPVASHAEGTPGE